MIVRQLIFTISAALALSSALLASTIRPPRALDLSLVKDRAICPIEVVVDYEPSRRPQRIKLLKCARDPLARCLAASVTRAHCCDWREDHFIGNCVEIIDYVAGTYRSAGGLRAAAAEAYAVSVGCTCMAVPTARALED